MSLVFPLIEKAPHKDIGFTDAEGRTVQIAERRYQWLTSLFDGQDDWWRQLTDVIRAPAEYQLLSPEAEVLLTRVFGMTAHELASPFTALRGMKRVGFLREQHGDVRDPIVSCTAAADGAAKLDGMRPHIGSTGLYAMDVGPMLWVPLTVQAQTGPDAYTVVLHFEHWRQRNPRFPMLGLCRRPQPRRAKRRRAFKPVVREGIQRGGWGRK